MKKEFFKLHVYDIVYCIGFMAAVFFMIWKSRYGFGENDEAFYLTLPFRLFKGDSLFSDDYHIAQLFSFLTFPIYAIYRTLVKTNEGIILNFRYIYIFCQALSAVFIYRKIKKINRIGAVVASLVFLLYSPFNLMTLSYNTICLMTFTLALLLYAFQENELEDYVSGLLYAMAVLCCPYLALSYFVLTLIVVFFCIKHKKSSLF